MKKYILISFLIFYGLLQFFIKMDLDTMMYYQFSLFLLFPVIIIYEEFKKYKPIKMKQLFNNDDIIGKTISQTLISVDTLWIKFTDKSFIIYELEDTTEGFGHIKNLISISDMEVDYTSHELVDLNLITKSEYDEAILEEEKQYEDSRRIYEEKTKKETEEYELELLAKLNKKYNL